MWLDFYHYCESQGRVFIWRRFYYKHKWTPIIYIIGISRSFYRG